MNIFIANRQTCAVEIRMPDRYSTTVMSGVTVGKNAVVGIGPVVNKDVEDNTIVADNPARLIKQI